MSSLDASLAVIAALAVVLGVFLYAVLALGWRVLHDDGRLRLQRMLRRQGADLDRATGLNGYQAAVATRRCVACADQAECDAWLASGARGVPKFCPNADFISRLTARWPAHELEHPHDEAVATQITSPARTMSTLRSMDDAVVYPLGYQLSLGWVIRERLALLRAKGAVEDAARMQDALARLHRSDFGECISCGSVIPYLDIMADPASRHCHACKAP